MSTRWTRTALLVVALAVAATGWLGRSSPPAGTPLGEAGAPEAQVDFAPAIPAEARETLGLMRSGGPFPYDRDGTTFQNRERLLPQQPRGYYREYTVPTPGSRDRGARRIVAGGDPPREFYYTDDHYRSFRRIEDTH